MGMRNGVSQRPSRRCLDQMEKCPSKPKTVVRPKDVYQLASLFIAYRSSDRLERPLMTFHYLGSGTWLRRKRAEGDECSDFLTHSLL